MATKKEKTLKTTVKNTDKGASKIAPKAVEKVNNSKYSNGYHIGTAPSLEQVQKVEKNRLGKVVTTADNYKPKTPHAPKTEEQKHSDKMRKAVNNPTAGFNADVLSASEFNGANKHYSTNDEQMRKNLINDLGGGLAFLHGVADKITLRDLVGDDVVGRIYSGQKGVPTQESFARGKATLSLLDKNSDAHKTAYNVGEGAGTMASYAMLNPVLKSIPALATAEGAISNAVGGGKLGQYLGETTMDIIPDILLDTTPKAIQNVKSGMPASDVAKEALKNIGVNELYNLGAGALPYLGDVKQSINNVIDSNKALKETVKNFNANGVNVKPLEDTFNSSVNRTTKDLFNVNDAQLPQVGDVLKYDAPKPKAEVMAESIGTSSKPQTFTEFMDSNVEKQVNATNGADLNGVNRGGEKKYQKARTNTLENSGLNTAEELSNKYLNSDNFIYETDTDAWSVERAIENMANDPEHIKKLMDTPVASFQNQDVDSLFIKYRELVDDARSLEGEEADAVWKEAANVYKKISDVGTEGGRTIEAFKKWKLNTEEGIIDEFMREARDTVKREVGDKKAKEFIDYMYDEHLKEITEHVKKAQELGTDTRAGKKEFAKIGKLIDKYSPKTIRGRLTTILMDNMLGNFRTLIARNAGGNLGYNALEFARQPITATADRIVSSFTGQRTRTGWNGNKIASAIRGFTNGVKEELGDLASGMHTAKSGEELATAIGLNQHAFSTNHNTDIKALNKGLDAVGTVANKLDDLVKHGLSAGDRPFYESAYAQRIAELNDLRAKNLLGDTVAKMTDEQFNTFAQLSARLDGLTATYQDSSAAANALTDAKKFAGDLSKSMFGVDIMSQFSAPFVRTPGNIIQRAVEYSPVGFIKNAGETISDATKGKAFNQRRFVDELGRNILGTGIFVGGTQLAKNGIINGAYSDDTDVATAQRNGGMIEYGLNYTKDGQKRNADISWLPVLGTDLVMASAFNDALNNSDKDGLQALPNASAEALGTLWNQSAMQGLQRLTGGSNTYSSGGFGQNVKNTIESGLSQLEPSIMRQIANVTDEYQRDLSNGEMSYAQKNLYNGIPKVREKLEPKVDNEGNLVKSNQGRPLFDRIIENMVSPMQVKDYTYSNLVQEAIRLNENTAETKQFNPTPNRKDISTVDSNGRTVTPSDADFREYKENLGKLKNQLGNIILNSREYNSLSDDEKVEMLSNMYSGAKAYERSKYGFENDNKMAKILNENGPQAAAQYLLDQSTLKKYGLDASDKNLELLRTGGVSAVREYAETKDALNQYGFTMQNTKAIDAYNNGSLEQFATMDSVFDAYDWNSSEENIDFYNSVGADSFKKYGDYITSNNLKNNTQSRNLFSQMGVDGLSLLKSADTDKSGTLKKDDELLPYLKSKGYTLNEVNTILPYLGWKPIDEKKYSKY